MVNKALFALMEDWRPNATIIGFVVVFVYVVPATLEPVKSCHVCP
jgi:hypothetical protein